MTKITKAIKPFVTTLPIPSVAAIQTVDGRSTARIEIKQSVATIYADGCNTITVPIWGYEGEYLGPTVIVRKGQMLDVEWVNGIGKDEKLPFRAIKVDQETATHAIPQNQLGIESDYEPTTGDQCSPLFTTHLHGGKIPPTSDGWPESMMMPGQNSLKRYENNQRATLLWYHDHAMHTTRLNVYAGLAGAWIITDAEEDALQFPTGDKMLPLVIQDRNLSETEDNVFNNNDVRLLHKVEGLHGNGPMEFAGPLTLVNGRIWPSKAVEPTCYRLRLLNGANSRAYGLVFAFCETDDNGECSYTLLTSDQINGVDENNPVFVRQIGSDGGLLATPVKLPLTNLGGTDYPVLILSPAERADVLIDFSHFAGRKIVLLNCAVSPFANEFINPIERLDGADYSNKNDLLAYPQVMQFSVAEAVTKPVPYNFTALDSRFKNLHILTGKQENSFTHDKGLLDSLPPCCKTRTIAIVEKTMNGKPMLVLWELLTECELILQGKNNPVLRPSQSVTIGNHKYYVVAERFQDLVSYMVEYGTTECWRFINLTADTHPMHLHLVQFIAQLRKGLSVNGKSNVDEIKAAVDAAISDQQCQLVITALPNGRLDENEQGFKDTIRVNPAEMVELKAHFDGYLGRYVYHCHLLEHEDHDMMRQFVVTRNDLHESMKDKEMFPVSIGIKVQQSEGNKNG